MPRPNRVLEFAFVCEAATTPGGSLNALGIGSNIITAPALPTMHQFTFVLRIAWLGDLPQSECNVAVTVTDPDDEAIAGVHGFVPLNRAENPHPELPMGMTLPLPLPVMIGKPGLHKVNFTVDGDEYPPVPFKVVVGPLT